LWYHFKQLLQGNFSHYFYRPLFFAMRNRIRDFITRSRPPTWGDYLKRKALGYKKIEIQLKLKDVKAPKKKVLTGKEEGWFNEGAG
jgi:hypothetical protein